MNQREMDRYYTGDYFAGRGWKSPYPEDGRYLDPHHPIIDRKFHNLWSAVAEQQPIRHGGELRLLDVGCGPAHTESVFRKIDERVKVWNTDGFEAVAKFAAERGSSRVGVSDQRALPFINNFFGVVTMWDVIEHVKEDEAHLAIEEAHRVLDNGGVIAIRTPNKVTWTSKYRQDAGHFWFPTPGGLKQMLTEAGFAPESMKIRTRGFPGTSIFEKVFPAGDWYMPAMGGVIVATAKKYG